MTIAIENHNAPNDMKRIKDNFINALGSGTAALNWACLMIASVADSRDTTVFIRALKRMKNKKDDHAARVFRVMIETVFDGAKVTTNKKSGEPQFKIGKGHGPDGGSVLPDMGAVLALRKCYDDSLSLRGTAVVKRMKEYAALRDLAAQHDEAVKAGTMSEDEAKAAMKEAEKNGVEPAKPAFEASEWAEKQVKRNGAENIEQMIAALQALRAKKPAGEPNF